MKPQPDPRLNLTGKGYCAHCLADEETSGQNSTPTGIHIDDYRIRTTRFRHSGVTCRVFCSSRFLSTKKTTEGGL